MTGMGNDGKFKTGDLARLDIRPSRAELQSHCHWHRRSPNPIPCVVFTHRVRPVIQRIAVLVGSLKNLRWNHFHLSKGRFSKVILYT
jgi:hypothetical protein